MPVSQAIQEEVLKEAYSTTPNYTVDYEDKRLTSVTDERDDVLADNKTLYGGMIGSSDQYFDKQIQASKDWADKQTQLQNERTDFTIEQIEQQKDQAQKDYIKEQSGAYVDWQKQSNQYGVEAEKMASAGLTGTGYSESSQVSMYNTYQNRVATARESYNKAVLNYDNAIKDAQLQNNAALAEIAYQSLQKQLELSLQGFQYKNQLLLEQANKELEIKNMYHNQWMDRLNQINTENAIAEEIRQYNETMKWNTEQAELNRQFEADQAKLEREFKAAQAILDREHEEDMLKAKTAAEKEILDKEYEIAVNKLAAERAEKEKLLKYEYELKQSSSTPITGSSGGTGSSKGVSNIMYSLATRGGTIDPNNNKSTSPTLNQKSKLNVGKGPISDTKAAQMVNNNKANAVEVNGQIYIQPLNWTPTQLPTSQLKQNANKGSNTTKNTKKTTTYLPTSNWRSFK